MASLRQHIWTFAADYRALKSVGTAPSFVGKDYFCDTIGGGNVASLTFQLGIHQN